MNPWLLAIEQLKQDFSKQKNLKSVINIEYYISTIPKKLKQHLTFTDSEGNVTGLQAKRYEFWVYRQIIKRLKSGELYVDDSINHRYFEHELDPLVSDDILKQFGLPCLQNPIEKQIDALSQELKKQWELFNEMIKQNNHKHIQYDAKSKTISFHKPKIENEEYPQEHFYGKLQVVDNIDVLRFVNEKCGFLSAFTPMQPRYVKQPADDDGLLAVITSQAMNHGRAKLAKISDISYNTLSHIYQQYFRKTTLQEANDIIISNALSQLPIFNHYSFDVSTLYGSVDGQKYITEHPTTKARHSKKYFGKGRGVVSYTLLANHIPLQGELIGAHEHESYYVFEIFL